MSSVEKIKKLIIKERDVRELQEWKERELFFFECEELAAQYTLHAYDQLKGKKVANINSSTIAYMVGITDDKPTGPMSASATSLPDIDYDTNARDEVKNYLVYKFGPEKVTLMGTFGTLKLKGAVKDVMRQLRPDMDFKEVNNLTKEFDGLKRTDYKSEEEYYRAGLEQSKVLKDYFEQNPDVEDAMLKLLNQVRSTGIHAGGIIVSGKNVNRVVPCSFERKKEFMYVTQPDMKYVEWAGLIKYDFLGLNTLNDINKCFRHIEKRTGKILRMSDIPKNDPVVMRLFREGDTMSVFQFGTFLAHHLLTQLKEVRNINDLSIITSIARPGPLEMGMDKTFIKRVNKDELVSYLHESLKPILEETYGIYTYQEQIMQTVKQVGDLTGNESVVVLKAMGKKQLDKLVKFEGKFKENAVKKFPDMAKIIDYEDPMTKNTKQMRVVDACWDLMAAFALYGFNRSHAIAYSTVSYICMWLKHYYKIEWITGVLSNSSKDDFKEFYAQWHKYINKPDINKSKMDYVIESVDGKERCIMPISFIEGIGDAAVTTIVNLQPYTSFQDFFTRIDKRKVNKKATLHLILSGAFDSLRTDLNQSFADYRRELIKEFYGLKNKVKKPSKKEVEEQREHLAEVEAMKPGKFLMEEVKLLNLTAFNYYEFYKEYMTRYSAVTPKQAKTMDHDSIVWVGGAVESIMFFPIKNGKNRGKDMARIKIINEDATISITVFSNYLERDVEGKNLIRDLQEYTPIIIRGKVQRDEKYGVSLQFEAGVTLT